MGGLGTALRLGRSNLIEESGFRVDIGPTILVMKEAFEELYASLDQDINERLKFVQLEPNYRVYYHDGDSLDLYSNMARLAAEVERVEPGSAERLFRFIGASARKYELGMDFVDRNFDRVTDLLNPKAGLRLLETSAHQNLYRQVGRFFNHSDKLTKAFTFHSMFLGLSPFDALAMYSLITYADLALGMWYPRGGIYSLVEDMVHLGEEMGVQIRTNSPVEEIVVLDKRARGVRLNSGEMIEADLVISNADLPYTYRKLIPSQYRGAFTDRRLDGMEYACSGYLLYLGVDKAYPHLRHQSLYFSQDYRANLDDIFKRKVIPQEPSFHLSVPTVTDPSLAPEGHSLIEIDWVESAPRVRDRLLDRLEAIVDPHIRQHIVWERDYRPTDWQMDVNAEFGTAFGSLSQGFFQSAYFRPHNKSREVGGLYFVGQGTYPGIGMPMVMISSKLVTERIKAEWVS